MSLTTSTKRALVVVPGTANYFYDQAGQRVTEALREGGWHARLETLATAEATTGEWCFLVNLSELLFSRQQAGDGLQRVVALRAQCPRLIHVLLEAAGTQWFMRGCELGAATGVDALFDLGLHSQGAQVETIYQPKYRFVLNGLLAAERQWLQAFQAVADTYERPLPWALIGHQTTERVKLATRLVCEYDARGFFYLPKLEPVTAEGPHLNEAQFYRVLGHTRYQVWCSHHAGFYLEGERFRASLLTGGVPLKINLQPMASAATTLFDYLLLNGADFPARMQALDFTATRQRFAADFHRLPGLSESLLAACRDFET